MSVCTVEYYSLVKRNEALVRATAWVDPDTITLNDRRESERSHIL